MTTTGLGPELASAKTLGSAGRGAATWMSASWGHDLHFDAIRVLKQRRHCGPIRLQRDNDSRRAPEGFKT